MFKSKKFARTIFFYSIILLVVVIITLREEKQMQINLTDREMELLRRLLNTESKNDRCTGEQAEVYENIIMKIDKRMSLKRL